LSDKGFCVLKYIQSTEERANCLDALKVLDGAGRLGRLAKEVEEGYLGKAGRAKVMWLDPENGEMLPPEMWRSDGNFTALAEMLQGSSEDALGVPLSERTPALACLSMTDRDEEAYENPPATDDMIEEFFSTWNRGVLRVIHFMGPGIGQALLEPKDTSPLPGLTDQEITASANTILLMREDAYFFTYEEPADGEACWLQSVFMKEGPDWDIGEIEGDLSVFQKVADGPPPPDNSAGNLVGITAISIQACGKMTGHEAEWAAYTSGIDGQVEMPFMRFDYWPYYDDEVDNPQGTTFVKHLSVQDGLDLFDNRVFEISNMEAECMDPQMRQVMEVGYMSCFAIGHTKKFANTNPLHASVSVGCDKQEWLNLPDVSRSVATNNQLAISANRFSYSFNLKGGSFVIDTACSSSLIAAHLGKMNLLERRWDPLEWHLGVGVEMNLTIGPFCGRSSAHMTSPSGRCLTFNATANGYNVGDGTAAMILRAGQCQEQRMCFFRGSQIGQDGRSASMSAPNGPAQEKCIWGAIREGQMKPPESTVWECHGTGTSLGDPIEVGAVRKVQIKMKRLEPLMIASSKSNFGHLEGGASAIAMNKCVMVVVKITCAPTQHFKTLNPHLEHAAFDAIFCSEHNPYKYKQGHCQVSSFGVGGTNGHAVFWGEGHREPPDTRRIFLNKMALTKGKILTDGVDPKNWESSGLAFDAKPGDTYNVIYSKNPMTNEDVITYEKQPKQEEEDKDEEESGGPLFFSTTGNHNDWVEDRMIEGEVDGLWWADVEIPEGGDLEFRILQEGEDDQAIGPETTTKSRWEPIVGPMSGLTSKWVIKGKEGDIVKIEFFSPPDPKLKSLRTIWWSCTAAGKE
jgi:polyketide synthase-associated protein